ncbi:DUF6461 domain-containing protein [Streptomyces sp. NPDC090306]|uniref:DUF6461 domain-containing protein n=1 Tax=Streptomyces sp. NPDC090306 TaxID=3365961 RepID=UPI00381EFFC0
MTDTPGPEWAEPAPPVADSWHRIETWLAVHAPRTYASLPAPLSAEGIADAERRTGIAFPPDLAASLGRHNGVRGVRGTFGEGSVFVLPGREVLMDAEEIVRRAESFRGFLATADDPGGADEPWWHPQFLMFADGLAPDGLILDCRPGPGFGRVGDYGKYDGAGFQGPSGLAELLCEVADGLEQGRARDAHGWEYVPVVWEGGLIWQRDPGPLPPLPSLFALAAARTEPAPADPDHGRAPVAEEGWAGEYANFTLTFVHGVDDTELLRRFGAVESTRRPRTREEASADATRWTSGCLPVVRAGRAGEWAFGIEETLRSQGGRAEVLRRLSAGTRAVSVRFSGQTFLTFYEDGTLVTEYCDQRPYDMDGVRSPYTVFDGLPPRPEQPEDPGPALPGGRRRQGLGRLLETLKMPTPETERAAREALRTVCDVVARHFGIDLPTGALTGPLPSAHVLPVLPAVRNLGGDPYGLSARAEGVPASRLWSALAEQAAGLCAETGLDTWAGVPEAVAAYELTGPAQVDEDSPLGTSLRTVLAESAMAGSVPHDVLGGRQEVSRGVFARSERAEAAQVLLAALSLSPRDALPYLLHGRRDPHAREHLLAALGGRG